MTNTDWILAIEIILGFLGFAWFLFYLLKRQNIQKNFWFCIIISLIYFFFFLALIYLFNEVLSISSLSFILSWILSLIILVLLIKNILKIDWKISLTISAWSQIVVWAIIIILMISGVILLVKEELPKQELTEQNCLQEGNSTNDCRIFIMALSIKDPTECKLITKKEGKYSQDNCYDSLLENQNSLSYCQNFNNISGGQYSKDNCYLRTAKIQNDESICKNIISSSGDYSRNSCYLNIAENKKDYKICRNVENQANFQYQDNCYRQVAALKKDISICDQLNGFSRIICRINIYLSGE